MSRKLKRVENETQTLCDLEFVEKHWKIPNNEKRTLKDLEYGKKKKNPLKNVENEKCTL